MAANPKTDPYLEKLRGIKAETTGIDARLSALEAGYALDAKKVDAFVDSQIADRPARYEDFLSEHEVQEIAVRYHDAINKGVECDSLEYALAAICGVASGLLDALLVSTPGEGVADGAADNMFDAAVKVYAKKTGWKPRVENKNNGKSAIGFFERINRVGYDQATSKSVSGVIKHLSTDNHHAKSAGHYPDVIGLVASISDQFVGTSTFYSGDERGIVFVEGTGKGVELKGTTFVSKVFAGAANWFGHCMSDVAGSSGSKGRGQGLPIPLTEFFQLCNFGKFPNDEGQWQSLATVMTQVYENGYDLRHGVATAFPVVINELFVRMLYVMKKHFNDEVPWENCLSMLGSPEVERLVTVGMGAMCMVDLAHATVTSWGNWIKFFSGLNVAAWARLGMRGKRELELIATRDIRNIESIDTEIAAEWDSLLARSRALLV